MTSARRRLLFLAPYLPDPSLGGAAVRVHAHLSILSRHFDVTLVVLSSHPTRGVEDIPKEVRSSLHGISFHRLDDSPPAAAARGRIIGRLPFGRLLRGFGPRPQLFREFLDGNLARRVAVEFRGQSFHAVHACRIATLPLLREVLGCLAGRPARVCLDLDDFESKTARRRAAAMARIMGRQIGLLHRLDAPKFTALERRALRLADAISLCSSLDRDGFNARYATTKATVVPNTVRDPGEPAAPREAAGPAGLLFVGNFHFHPNVEAIRDFIADVLPILRRDCPRPFVLRLVGRGAGGFEVDTASHPEIERHSDVPDLRSFYRDAAVVIAPIRSGGGTRIKIVEALSYGRPVVSTRLGAEGLEVTDGTDILLRDEPRDFAAACAALLADPDLRRRLGEAGRRLYLAKHAPTAVEKALLDIYRQ